MTCALRYIDTKYMLYVITASRSHSYSHEYERVPNEAGLDSPKRLAYAREIGNDTTVRRSEEIEGVSDDAEISDPVSKKGAKISVVGTGS